MSDYYTLGLPGTRLKYNCFAENIFNPLLPTTFQLYLAVLL